MINVRRQYFQLTFEYYSVDNYYCFYEGEYLLLNRIEGNIHYRRTFSLLLINFVFLNQAFECDVAQWKLLLTSFVVDQYEAPNTA